MFLFQNLVVTSCPNVATIIYKYDVMCLVNSSAIRSLEKGKQRTGRNLMRMRVTLTAFTKDSVVPGEATFASAEATVKPLPSSQSPSTHEINEAFWYRYRPLSLTNINNIRHIYRIQNYLFCCTKQTTFSSLPLRRPF